MTNTKRLKTIIDYSGIKYSVLAYKIGMSRTTLWSRLNNSSEFTSEERYYISKVLKMSRSQRRFVFGEDPYEIYIHQGTHTN